MTLFTNHCPNCKMLTKKLNEKNISFEVCDDVQTMQSKGFTSMPVLEVEGNHLNFTEAIKWLKEQ